jgi:hypothetical protein
MANSVSRHIEPLLPGGDAAIARLSLIPSSSEDVGIGSFGTEKLALTPSANEFMLADSGTENFALKASGTDVAVINDAATEKLAFTPSATDSPGQSADANTETLKLTPIGTDDPQYELIETGVEYLKFAPSDVDIHIFPPDAATERLAFSIDSHECYAISTPEYSVELSKRWDMQEPFARWEVGSIDTRWKAFIISTGFEIPC